MTREFFVYLFAIVALFVAMLCWLVSSVPAATYSPKTDTAVVKVMLKQGHGSGVHIGNGLVLSAAHVPEGVKVVILKTKDGRTRPAEVLWSSKEYDIAMLRTKDKTIDAATLDCRVAQVGEAITSYGNPLRVEFAAAYGRIAGEPRAFGHWRSVFVTDITTVMGQSGGPVFDAEGRLIGITVGVLAAPLGFSSSLVGYGFVVPSRAVCDLLARGMPA